MRRGSGGKNSFAKRRVKRGGMKHREEVVFRLELRRPQLQQQPFPSAEPVVFDAVLIPVPALSVQYS